MELDLRGNRRLRDPKRIVEESYDAISARYTSWSAEFDWPIRRRYVQRMVDLLRAGSRVLELGCGAGIPATEELARHFHVTGVDVSAEQVRQASANVPAAEFVRADMATVEFPEGTFDGVAAFYSITHLPREEHPGLLARVRRWLRPGGLFVASLGARGNPGCDEPDWLGAPMYFSSFDAETNLRLLDAAGFDVLESEVVEQDEGELGTAVFCWVVAKSRT
jgi:SAM-dependent methyltransferase